MKTTEKLLPATPFSIFTCFHRKWNIFYKWLVYSAPFSLIKCIENSHLLLLRYLIHPEVDVGAQESELGAGGEDQQTRLDFPVEVDTLHRVKQQEELSRVLKVWVLTEFNKRIKFLGLTGFLVNLVT